MAIADLFWLRVGCVSAALAVSLGAFGAHGLKNRITDPNLLKTWEVAAQYQMYHSLGIVAASIFGIDSKVNLSFIGGILLFSVLTGNKKLGIITPFGGALFIVGWLLFAYSATAIKRE